jgi:DNA invertase Pin-like site-specific DNA recombinase
MFTQGVETRRTFSIGKASANMADMGAKAVRAVGYCRVSTDMQAMHGISLDAQQKQIRDYASAYSLELTEVLVEAESAKDTKGRTQYQRMIELIDKGQVQTIIAPALDRFTRSQRDFLDFSHKYLDTGRVNLCLIKESINTNSPHGRQFLPLLVAFAQLERQQTAMRVSSAIAYIRSQGGHYGKVPFGYSTVQDGRLKRLVPHPQNFRWIEQMGIWYRLGVSNSEIAKRLNAENVKPCSGNQWTENSVYLVLIREGIHKKRAAGSERIYDREQAYKIAYTLKAEERSLQYIADRLNSAGLRPSKASEYRTHSVMELLRSVPIYKLSTAIGLATYHHAQGKSLNKIAAILTREGHKAPRGGQWYAQTVRNLLAKARQSA